MSEPTTAEVIERRSFNFLSWLTGLVVGAYVVGAINVLRAGHARFACEVSDAVGSPAAGTHRSDSGAAQCHP